MGSIKKIIKITNNLFYATVHTTIYINYLTDFVMWPIILDSLSDEQDLIGMQRLFIYPSHFVVTSAHVDLFEYMPSKCIIVCQKYLPSYHLRYSSGSHQTGQQKWSLINNNFTKLHVGIFVVHSRLVDWNLYPNYYYLLKIDNYYCLVVKVCNVPLINITEEI